jgi:cell division septum initiation protein DivIVA
MTMARPNDPHPHGSLFSITMRGYDRTEVHEHLSRLDAEVRVTAADRDAIAAQANDLADQLDDARAEIQALREEVDRLAVPPTSAAEVSDRMARMLRLAADEASETRAAAHAEAAEIISIAEQNAHDLETRQNEEFEEWTIRRAKFEESHVETLAKARHEAERIMEAVEAKRRQLEHEAAAKQRQQQEDFDLAMSERRAETLREIDELMEQARQESERRIAEATAEAEHRILTATDHANNRINYASGLVQELGSVRDRILAQLESVRAQMDTFPSALASADNEASLLDDADQTVTDNEQEAIDLREGKSFFAESVRSS